MAINLNGTDPGAGFSQQNNNTSPSTGAASTAPRPNQSGSGFVNLQKVVNANKTNQLGSSIQQGIGQSVDSVKAGVQNSQNNFNQQLQQNTLNNDQNNNEINNVLADPTKATNDQTNDFAKFRNGAYTGQQTLSNADSLQRDAQQTQQMGQNANSSGGRQALLQQYAGGNQYTAGQQHLDNLILGQTGGQNLAQARRSTVGLAQQTTDAANAAAQQAQQVTAQNHQYGADLMNRFGTADNTSATGGTGLFGDLNGQLQNQLTSAKTTNAAAYNKFINDLNNKTVTTAEAQQYLAPALGVTDPNNLYNQALYNYSGSDLAKLFQQQDPTLSSVTTGDQAARYNALLKLSGKTQNDVGITLDPTQVGNPMQAAALNAQGQAFGQNLTNLNKQYADQNTAAKNAQDTAARLQSGQGQFYTDAANFEDYQDSIGGRLGQGVLNFLAAHPDVAKTEYGQNLLASAQQHPEQANYGHGIADSLEKAYNSLITQNNNAVTSAKNQYGYGNTLLDLLDPAARAEMDALAHRQNK